MSHLTHLRYKRVSLTTRSSSSSVGALTIQLAKSSGYEVVTTASKRNFDFVKGIGADHVLDYNLTTIVDELVDLFKGKTAAGAYDAIASGNTTVSCAEVLVRRQVSSSPCAAPVLTGFVVQQREQVCRNCSATARRPSQWSDFEMVRERYSDA